jgi:hypothetical protein
LHRHLAAVQRHEPLGQRQAEAGALGAHAARLGDLLEFVKQPRQVLDGDAHAGVGDIDRDVVVGPVRVQAHRPAARRELDAVAHQVVEHLLDAPRVEVDLRQRLRDRHLEVDPLLRRLRLDHAAHDVDDAAEVRPLADQIHAPGFDLGDVEDVVDQLQQMAPRDQHVADV